ncbi:hypothetical protein MTX78_03790 [Hymenobacter tibetensis]|uniref:Uncharacterized protein n=1 Tax=Hymenobacter tibetensis TaxID=497967 RepID=A0ABY4D066_9BACT|nr:hypothetical protein [Hymenobacter tibetensis]UOG75721.1 hypothetical protein MTX78_03790 [Hymenobacter tibetensis]
MKTKSLFVAATLFFGTVATTQAQISPTAPQRGGSMNQTTVPAAPQTNPGTIDQRTPTTTNPTQMGTGTIDQRTSPPMTAPAQMGTGTVAQPPLQRSTTIEQQSVEQRTGTTTQPANSGTMRRETSTKKRTTETTTPRP